MKKYVCPPAVKVERLSDEELNCISQALSNDQVETCRCPSCNTLSTKDENCDKVTCGRVDGGRSVGCGTQFCFRCGDDISALGYDYLEHLIASMKPDGSYTQWICRKFAKACPDCNTRQFWDGHTQMIRCGICKQDFDVANSIEEMEVDP